ncbi:MAG: carbohydrate-binding domain-containing protein, partial [Muribaculaceae bacterium]|nr:carbohydrate-binding domain-containing protein [Muribaculaceae bacterium]
TTNRLEDGSTYTDVANEDMKGTLFSEGQIIVSGKGTLNVIANGRNAIASDDYLLKRPGVILYAKALMRNGIKTNHGVWIDGGVINIETTASGAKGINCEANVAIAGGRTTIIGSGGVTVEQGDTTSCAGVKCDSTLTMTGGTLNIKMTGEGAKGINVNGNFAFDGGELNIVTTGEKGLASPKGVKCDGAMSITAGSFYVYSTNAAALDVAGTFMLAEGYKSKETGPHYYVVIF